MERRYIVQQIRFGMHSVDVFLHYTARLHKSDVIASGVQFIALSPYLRCNREKFIEYKLQTALEFGVLHPIFRGLLLSPNADRFMVNYKRNCL